MIMITIIHNDINNNNNRQCRTIYLHVRESSNLYKHGVNIY